MSLADLMIPQPAALPGAINSVIGPLVTASLASTTFVIPYGAWFSLPVANLLIEIQDPAATWNTVYGASTGGFIVSDGVNFRIRTTATVSYKLYRVTYDRLYYQPGASPAIVPSPGVVGSYIAAAVTAALTVGQTFLIAQGAFISMPVANITLEIQDPAATWTVMYAASQGGYFISDGSNFRIKATGSASYKLYKYL